MQNEKPSLNAMICIQKDKDPENEIRFGRQEYMDSERIIKARNAIKDFFQKPSKKKAKESIFPAFDVAIQWPNNHFVHEIEPGTYVYRARIVTDNDCKTENGISIDENGHTTGFNAENSLEAPPNITKAGRNNRKGESFLYVAKDFSTACAEMKALPGNVLSVATIKIKEKLKLFDFSKTIYMSLPDNDGLDCAAIFHEMVRLFYKPINEETKYKATQILSEYVRNKGFDGVAYVSYHTSSMNYTIFSTDHKNYEFINSSLYGVKGVEQYYYSFNDNGSSSSNVKTISYADRNCKYMLDDIRKLLEINSEIL